MLSWCGRGSGATRTPIPIFGSAIRCHASGGSDNLWEFSLGALPVRIVLRSGSHSKFDFDGPPLRKLPIGLSARTPEVTFFFRVRHVLAYQQMLVVDLCSCLGIRDEREFGV